MTNRRPSHPVQAFRVDPGWYAAYWLEEAPARPPRARRARLCLGCPRCQGAAQAVRNRPASGARHPAHDPPRLALTAASLLPLPRLRGREVAERGSAPIPPAAAAAPPRPGATSRRRCGWSAPAARASPSTMPALSAPPSSDSCLASMFPLSMSGTSRMSARPATALTMPLAFAAASLTALSKASGPSTSAPVIWPRSAILQSAAASSVLSHLAASPSRPPTGSRRAAARPDRGGERGSRCAGCRPWSRGRARC